MVHIFGIRAGTLIGLHSNPKQDEKKCRYTKAHLGATMSSYRDIKSKSEADLQVAVGTVGPISVAIDASHSSFQVSII